PTFRRRSFHAQKKTTPRAIGSETSSEAGSGWSCWPASVSPDLVSVNWFRQVVLLELLNPTLEHSVDFAQVTDEPDSRARISSAMRWKRVCDRCRSGSGAKGRSSAPIRRRPGTPASPVEPHERDHLWARSWISPRVPYWRICSRILVIESPCAA